MLILEYLQRLVSSRASRAAQGGSKAPAAAPAADDSMAKLQQLADLHSQGVLSDEEFTAAKAKVLGI
jgi:membrane protease subunit (stomatin/prohibitin family)